jgi:hypothetical protein
MVHLEESIRVIFQELEPVQLKAMWDADGEIQDSMIEIIYALYLIETSLLILTFGDHLCYDALVVL